MKRWNWSLAWAVLRGRVTRVERALGHGQDTLLVHLDGPQTTAMRKWTYR